MGDQDTIRPTSDIIEHSRMFERAFNSGDPEVVDQLFERNAIFVAEPDVTLTGEEMRSSIKEFLSLGLPMSLTTRHAYVADDIALVIVDWTISGTKPDGEEVHLEGTGTDVARRGADGNWRYLIDNRLGTSRQ